MGSPPEVFWQMKVLLREPGALERATHDRHLLSSLWLAHQHTWFVMDGVHGCAESTSGSQARDPLGDVFFIACYTRAADRVREQLEEQCLVMKSTL